MRSPIDVIAVEASPYFSAYGIETKKEHIAQPAPAKEWVSILLWEKDGVEGYGLVKLDLLGNRSLAVVRDALAAIDSRGEGPERRTWFPEEDAATQALMASCDARRSGRGQSLAWSPSPVRTTCARFKARASCAPLSEPYSAIPRPYGMTR
ncbi:MAG: hypothetical protein JST05_02075 [Acidobacteria bacterium]|nr:hypothetical protein [Acidobacteriota bacterium]